MDMLYAAILGLVQGIAEFLPISSSGHLALFENVLGASGLAELDDSALFNIMLHLATLVAVCVAYWSDVKGMVTELGRMGGDIVKGRGLKPDSTPLRRQLFMLILATLPLVLVVPVHNAVESLNDVSWFIGVALILTGVLLFVSDRMPQGSKTEKDMTVKDALVIGLAQAVATVPGLSRSGTTITAGMGRGLKRSYAVRFSFLMSLLSVLGAVVLEVLDEIGEGFDLSMLPAYLVGMAVAGVTGYLSIRLLQKIVAKGRFGGFAYYCWAVGALTIVLSLVLS